jgi:pimeloyl-ACP methyl ester carboxylesterase
MESTKFTYKGYSLFRTYVKASTINFAKIGKGPALVLVHGLTDNWYSWGRMFPYLQSHFTMYIPDLPGYGASDEIDDYSVEIMADYITEFVNQLNEPVKALVGISMGSAIVAESVKKLGSQVESAILTGPVIKTGKTKPMTQGLNVFMRAMGSNRVTTHLLKYGISTNFAAQNLGKYLNLYDYDPEIITEYNIGGKRQMSARAYPKMGVSVANYSLKDTLLQHTTPALLIYGKQDKVSKADDARRLITPYRPQTDVVEIDRAGHWVIADKPMQVAENIINYLL